jgi:eukaryotic-like serine/threonine-protein kinase
VLSRNSDDSRVFQQTASAPGEPNVDDQNPRTLTCMHPASPQPQRIGEYEIVDTVASTGKVQVYRAVERASKRPVTLKTIGRDADGIDVAATIAHFQHQARMAARLNHPGIVPVYEYGEDSRVAFLATEYVEGCALKEGMRVPANDAISIIVQLLTGLDHAHGQGVIHGNIAPPNLLLTSKGEVRLTEFGIAGAGSAVGSYMSPEQIEGLEIDRRSDIFSVGVLFYELLTGTNPFAGPPDSLIRRVLEEKERAVSAVSTSIPRVFDGVCARALAKAKEDRYQTAGSFCESVRAACEAAFGRPPRDVVSNEVVVSIFLSSLRAPSRRRSSSKSRAQLTESQTTVEKVNSRWEDATLRAIEKQLAVYLGPLARVVIKQAASRTTDLDELYAMAAENLEKEDERQAFLARTGQASRSERKVEAGPVQQASVSPDSATAAMLRTERKPEPKPFSLLRGNSTAKPQMESKVEPPLQRTEHVNAKTDSNLPGNVRSSRLPVAPKFGAAPDSKPSAASTSGTNQAQSDAVPGVRPEATAKTNSEVRRELQLRAQSESQSSDSSVKEDDVASRLEELLGKQPADLAGYLSDSPPQLDAVIYALIASVEALVAACASGGRVAGLVPQSISFDRVGKATIASSQSNVTQSTSGSGVVGSPRYAAPEIFAEDNGSDASGMAANIYALGFIFFEILLGRQLFRNTFSTQRTELDWLRWHADLKSKAPTLKSLLPEHPAGLSELLESMTEKSPEKRTSDLEMILSRLRGIAQQASRTMVVRRPAESPEAAPAKTVLGRPPRKRKRWTIVILLVIVIALAGLLLWQFPDLFRRLLSPFFHHPA